MRLPLSLYLYPLTLYNYLSVYLSIYLYICVYIYILPKDTLNILHFFFTSLHVILCTCSFSLSRLSIYVANVLFNNETALNYPARN